MDAPTLVGARAVAPDLIELASYLPVPGFGLLPVNAFALRGEETVLVDTGLAALAEPFLDLLESVVDPAEIRWIWLSHMDADHLGNLRALLERAPRAEIVTNFLGMGKLALAGLPTARVRVLAPGERLALPDRTLVPLRPPYYDAPETMGFFDTRTRALFSADAFGALMPEPAEEAAAISAETLRAGMTTWSSIDAPWLAQLDRGAFGRALSALERLDPEIVLSGHLPSARGITRDLLAHLAAAQASGPVDAPDHDEIERLVAAHS